MNKKQKKMCIENWKFCQYLKTYLSDAVSFHEITWHAFHMDSVYLLQATALSIISRTCLTFFSFPKFLPVSLGFFLLNLMSLLVFQTNKLRLELLCIGFNGYSLCFLLLSKGLLSLFAPRSCRCSVQPPLTGSFVLWAFLG